MYRASISVPASLLLCGEYTITELNNYAISIATEPRAVLTIQQRTSTLQDEHAILLKGIFENRIHTWHHPHQCELWDIAAKVFPYIHDVLCTTAHKDQVHCDSPAHVTITIDSSAFFTTNIHHHTKDIQSKKRGLGSSEAAAVLICAAHLILAGYDPVTLPHLLAQYASRAHFVWQHNKGSGYGVYTAIFGNVGMYHTTKPYPTWTPLPALNNVTWAYWAGTHAVSSRNALVSFQQWRAKHKIRADILCTKINHHIQQCPHNTPITDEHHNHIVQWFGGIRDLGIELGKAIYVDAIIHPPHLEQFHAWKASGAGNEIGIGIIHDEPHGYGTDGVVPIHVGKGIQWNDRSAI